MNKLEFSSMKSLDQLRSLSGSLSGSAKKFQMSSRPSSDSISMGSFANLKLTAEKLVKEQASVKTDLDMATTKLKKSMEHIHSLEEKLQNAINENAKLKVKQKEDTKLWKGLESKFSSTKTLCDQLTETLQHLACQVRDAEQDKNQLEDKLSESSKAFDCLDLQMKDLAVKLESAEENIKKSKAELIELKVQKEEMEKRHTDENSRAVNLIGEKDALIKDLEGTVAADKMCFQSLNSRLEEVQHELSLKEDICKCLTAIQNNLEKEKSALQLSNDDFARRLLASGEEIKGLETLVHELVEKLIELDKHGAMVSDNIVQLNHAFDTCYKLVQQEKDLTANRTQIQIARLDNQLLHVTSEKEAFQSGNEDLKNKVIELQSSHESFMAQHAEESRLAEVKVQKIESEAEALVSKKTELELLVSQLEEKIEHLSEASKLSENKMQELLQNISTLESENQDVQDKMQVKLQEKADEIESLQKEILSHEQHVDLLEKQVSILRDNLEEKEQLHLQFSDREKHLEDQRIEIQKSLAAAENTLAETKKQYDLMLESKQLELSKHLKEISQRNDQAINDIRRKSETEKMEIINHEKEKAEKLIGEMERKCDQKLAESKEEANQYLMRVQDEHASLINRIRQEYDKKELDLRADHSKEQKLIQLQAEDELREKTTLLRKDHEAQIKALRCQHEDEYGQLKEELELQKSKEERQRALLQLQWKVMDDNPKEDQEVTSKKDYSISSIKKDTDGGRRNQYALRRPESGRKAVHKTDSPFLVGTQTPVANILKRVDKENTGGMGAVPNHSRKVTRREYEVETSNGRTVTKHKKTKSTVMFEDPAKRKRMTTPTTKASKDIEYHGVADLTKHLNALTSYLKDPFSPFTVFSVLSLVHNGGHPPRSSNIGDLFSEGSLNPYVDDPYQF